MIEKAASGFVISAKKAGGGEVSESEWLTIQRTLSDCMVREANAALFLKNCGAIE
jgi:hypothetical protein